MLHIHSPFGHPQLWSEQRFDAKFANHNCLVMEDKVDQRGQKVRVPFEKSEKLPTLLLLSLTDPAVTKSVGSALTAPFAQSGLGFHSPRSTAHIGRLSAAQVGELMHRRYHCGIDKIRAIPSTSADGTANIASSPKHSTCEHCSSAYSKKAWQSHSGHLTPAPPLPGKLHVDIKGRFPALWEGTFMQRCSLTSSRGCLRAA